MSSIIAGDRRYFFFIFPYIFPIQALTITMNGIILLLNDGKFEIATRIRTYIHGNGQLGLENKPNLRIDEWFIVAVSIVVAGKTRFSRT